ncbi:MAG: glycosyltransferase family 4 protein [Candidatus Methanosuratincola petrocarbonis]|nr:glycosyltransferase [Candidatus Methanosuratincola sp.]
MKQVMHISWEYPPWVVGELSQELKSLLPEIAKRVRTILVVRGDRDWVTEADGIRIFECASSIRSSPHILAYIHALNIDLLRGASKAIHEGGDVPVVHTHDWVSGLAGVYLKACFGAPLVASVYTTELTRSKALGSLLNMGIFDIERYYFNRSDLVVIKSLEMKEHLEENYGLESGKIALARSADELMEAYRRLQE